MKSRDQLTLGVSVKEDYFTRHPSEEIRKFAVECLSTPYTYSDWTRKYIILQTQKMPDENYIRQSYKAVLRFKLRKAKKVIKQIQDWFDQINSNDIDSDEYLLNLKVLQEVIRKRNEIADETGYCNLSLNLKSDFTKLLSI
jgi:DNA primase